jgi:RHS repeat-associated protein
MGAGAVVRVDYEQSQVRLDLWGGTSGTYSGFDRFGRIVDQRWVNYDTPADLVRHKHGYDRASNRLYREDTVAATLHDELYSYDGLHRLADMQRGTLNGSKDALSGGSKQFAQNWGLDLLGNWNTFKQDNSGGATWNLEQTRTHNDVNESTGIGATTGANWTDPAHDAAGNMTTMPKPHAPTEGFTADYDAWNRLVRLTDDDNDDKKVAEYAYNGNGWRVVKKTYHATQTLTQTRYFYYSEEWRIIEERIDGTGDADARVQYVWGTHYVDELICRDRTVTDPFDERVYALQDANFNVRAIVSDVGTVLERYRYTPYGQRTVLNANFTTHGDATSGGYAFAIGHQGLMYDAETGLIYNRNRMLLPHVGRYGQRDPLEQVNPSIRHVSRGSKRC